MIHLSVVIVTKNRALELSQCLGSLLSNSSFPDEIIVVDNNSTDQTKQLIEGFKKNTKIKIKYMFFKGEGYPTIYNKGLREANYKWVAFIDDDCVASIDWVKEIKKTIGKYPKTSAVMGWCGTYYLDNVFSQATLMLDNNWKQRSLDGNKVLDLEVLDNKNVVYNKIFLEKNLLEYDEKRVKYQNGASEDSDLGIQMQQVGGEAVCNKKMMIWHKDPLDWLWFIKKNIASWRSYKSLYFKWDLAAREKLKTKSTPLPDVVDDFGNQFNLSKFERLKLFVVAKQVMFLNRILPRVINEK